MSYKNILFTVKRNNQYNREVRGRISYAAPNGMSTAIRDAANCCGESVNGLVNRLINEEQRRMERL